MAAQVAGRCDGEHEDFDTGGDDEAEHTLGREGGFAEQSERDQHEDAKRCQLELDQADEELDCQDEEGDQHDRRGEDEHGDLNEVLEEADKIRQARDRLKDGLAGIETDLRDASGLQETGLAQSGAGGLEPERGETLEHRARERLPVADQKGEEAQKNDDRDAEAIAEAATRPTMRFVELKGAEQLDM